MAATSVLETKELAKFRYDMMLKGFMNKSELKKFLQVGEKLAVKAWDKMQADIDNEGLEGLNGGVLLTARVLKYLGMTKKEVIENYEREWK